MTVATLTEVLQPALAQGYAVAGLVCLGWEDARAYATAAEAEKSPVILQAGPGARAHMPVQVWGPMLRHLAESVSVPVVVHQDHGKSAEDCEAAIDAGFSSVMFDGSALPFDENCAQTARIAEMAHKHGVSCEGEIGFVGYASGAASRGTDPDEAIRFAARTGIDAMAVSVGNVHLQTDTGAGLDEARLTAIAAGTDTPLVIHGGSGVPHDQRAELARSTTVCKFNIGTELRQTFGTALRSHINQNPEIFDRIDILSAVHEPLSDAARSVMQNLGSSGRG